MGMVQLGLGPRRELFRALVVTRVAGWLWRRMLCVGEGPPIPAGFLRSGRRRWLKNGLGNER